ncbi:SH3 domain-containing C40 family peptidase [Exiguobacterium sp. s193]|uniref:C40 family peptidase n=1 Tax=Exiguobacterium sp. s193 TaxID=2751207 RepID=UPI001BE78456|nr:SH3 domain-containing C40 family peptidase [Exiguobacterium sp. s193]
MKVHTWIRLFLLLTLVVSSWGAVPQATKAATSKKVIVSVDVLNIRSKAAVNGKKLGQLKLGQAVTVTNKTSNNWYQLRYKGKTAYIAAMYTKNYSQKATAGLSKTGATIVSVAEGLKGRPYVFGATGPVSFDCSGFTSYVYRALGKSLPRTAASQYAVTKRTAPAAGDLVFFTHGSGIQHVGIAVDGSTMINANSYYGRVVKESFRGGYWGSRYVAAGTL